MQKLSNGTSGYQASISMIAVAYGTIAGERGFVHVNPDSKNPKHREVLVSEADARALEKRKLAERKDGSSSSASAALAANEAEAPQDGAAYRIPPEQELQADFARREGGREPDPILAADAQAPVPSGIAADDPDAPPAPADEQAKKPAGKPKASGS
jgi:hypothetical protein